MTDLTIAPGQLRVGDAERERVTDLLAEHHAAGRLTISELDERLTATLSARTRDELAATLADLPAAARPPAEPERRVPAPAVLGRRFHLVSYVVVLAGLWLIWALTGAGYPWPIWPMLGWGLGLLGRRGQLSSCGLRTSARG
ncbi:MAG TPA: DUF1707 domain-containing protein [Propionibacteriaceae bacterium]|nr:DUF1707 domain-containing protein [Propionibacteriaceae bacterium]